MDIYLRLPGYDAATRRPGYRGWLEVIELQFERPLLEREATRFTVFRQQDALSHVLRRRLRSGRAFPHVYVHQVEGSEALVCLRFDSVVVGECAVEGANAEAKERVRFDAASWQVE